MIYISCITPFYPETNIICQIVNGQDSRKRSWDKIKSIRWCMFYNFINTHNQNWLKLHQTVDNFLRILYQYILFAWISEKIMMYSTFLCANDSVDQCIYWRVIFTIIRRTKLQSLSYDHWGSTSMQRVPIELLALWLWHRMRYINIFMNTYTHVHMYIHLQFYIISYITMPGLIDHTISTIFF